MTRIPEALTMSQAKANLRTFLAIGGRHIARPEQNKIGDQHWSDFARRSAHKGYK